MKLDWGIIVLVNNKNNVLLSATERIGQVFAELDRLSSLGYADSLTPVLEHGGYLVKRDDLFEVNGSVLGGKARTCQYLCDTQGSNLKGIITAGSKKSIQFRLATLLANYYNVPLRVHCPKIKELSSDLAFAKENGAQLFHHFPAHTSVIVKRARDDAQETGFTLIPYGMECWEAVYMTALQVKSLVELYRSGKFRRLVMPIGSGMSFSGVLWGLYYFGLTDVPVLGVQVGGKYEKRLATYAPPSSILEDNFASLDIVSSPLPYHKFYEGNMLGDDFILDPIYEAKCLDFMEEGDLLWSVAVRSGLE